MTLNPYLARLLPNEFMGIGFGIRDVFLSLGCACGLFISGFLSNSILVFSIYLAVVAGLLLIIILRTKMREIKEIEEDEEDEEEENLTNFKNMPTRLKVNFVLLVFIGMFILFGWLYDWNYEYMIIIGSGFLVIAMVLCLGILEEEKAE